METEHELGVRLGASIREARKARRWTQATLAEHLDVSVTYVGMMERGENLPSLPLLIQLAGLFGCSVAALVGEPSHDPWIDEVVALLRTVPTETRTIVVGMVRAAAASVPVKKRAGRRPAQRRT